jgi:hypothetical protein
MRRFGAISGLRARLLPMNRLRLGAPTNVLDAASRVTTGILLGLLSAAHAGTCRHYSDGPDSVTAREDGSVIVRHQDGRVDRYGTPNAEFERYPGQGGRPVFERREEP